MVGSAIPKELAVLFVVQIVWLTMSVNWMLGDCRFLLQDHFVVELVNELDLFPLLFVHLGRS